MTSAPESTCEKPGDRSSGVRALPAYALITPARNEAALIELTLKSVTSQKLPPAKWVVVSDGSTDGTDEIVSRYAAEFPWIDLVRMPERAERHFAGKAYAVNTGLVRLADVRYDVIGNLDADVSFESDYFEYLMTKFAENARLGVAGTAFHEGKVSYNYDFVGLEHVSGMCQMFRRECFEQIGGYAPVRSGGIDLIAVLSARSRGWETRTFTERTFVHHRSQNSALHAGLRERVHMGRKDYMLGNHPLWEIFRSVYQMKYKPYVMGGVVLLGAYMWNMVRGVKRSMPDELMAIRRGDQMKRLSGMFRRKLGMAGRTA